MDIQEPHGMGHPAGVAMTVDSSVTKTSRATKKAKRRLNLGARAPLDSVRTIVGNLNLSPGKHLESHDDISNMSLSILDDETMEFTMNTKNVTKTKRQKVKKTSDKKNEKKFCRRKHLVNNAAVHLVEMLKELLANHEWDAAAKTLYTLTYEPVSATAEVIWHAGFQILCNHPKSTPELLVQFAVAVTKLNVFVPTVILDCVMYFLSREDLSRANEILQLYRSQYTMKMNDRKTFVLLTLQGYKGLMSYMEWKSINSEVGSAGDADSEVKLKAVSSKACMLFEDLFKNPGGWDLFVRKYIEIKEYYNEVDSALEVVKEYCTTNPLNPKAYLFQYDLLQKHFPDDSEGCLNIIKTLMLLDPSEEKLLDISKYVDVTERVLPLQIIFNMVDFESKRNHWKLWCYFANIIIKMFKLPIRSEFMYLKDIWKDRKSWWQKYHFDVAGIQIVDEKSASLQLHKGIVLSGLSRIDSTNETFIKEVSRQLTAQEFNKMASQLATVTSLTTTCQFSYINLSESSDDVIDLDSTDSECSS